MSAERIADLERELAYTLRLLSDARTQHTEWVVAHQKDTDAAWREVAEAKRALSEASILELQARTAETLDAERYRYLRDAAPLEEDGPSVVSGLGDLFEYHWGVDVDEEVDAAIARWKARGCPTQNPLRVYGTEPTDDVREVKRLLRERDEALACREHWKREAETSCAYAERLLRAADAYLIRLDSTPLTPNNMDMLKDSDEFFDLRHTVMEGLSGQRGIVLNARHAAGVRGLPARADSVPSPAVGVANGMECGSTPPGAHPVSEADRQNPAPGADRPMGNDARTAGLHPSPGPGVQAGKESRQSGETGNVIQDDNRDAADAARWRAGLRLGFPYRYGSARSGEERVFWTVGGKDFEQGDQVYDPVTAMDAMLAKNPSPADSPVSANATAIAPGSNEGASPSGSVGPGPIVTNPIKIGIETIAGDCHSQGRDPQRRFVLLADIQGDTREDVACDLHDLAHRIEHESFTGKGIMGSPSCGHIVRLTENGDTTHDSYFEALEAKVRAPDGDCHQTFRLPPSVVHGITTLLAEFDRTNPGPDDFDAWTAACKNLAIYVSNHREDLLGDGHEIRQSPRPTEQRPEVLRLEALHGQSRTADEELEYRNLINLWLPALINADSVNAGLWDQIDSAKKESGYTEYWDTCRHNGTGGWTFEGYLKHQRRKADATPSAGASPEVKP